jgi:hypothetical protein
MKCSGKTRQDFEQKTEFGYVEAMNNDRMNESLGDDNLLQKQRRATMYIS